MNEPMNTPILWLDLSRKPAPYSISWMQLQLFVQDFGRPPICINFISYHTLCVCVHIFFKIHKYYISDFMCLRNKLTLVSQTVFVFCSERGAANTSSIIFQFCGKLTTLLQSFENTTLELNEFLQKVILNNYSFSLFLGCRVFCQVTYSASEKVNFRCICFVEIKTKLTI